MYGRISTVVAVAALAGCSSLYGVSPDVSYEVLVAATRQCDTPPSHYDSPANMMIRGYADVRAACEVFFVEATKAQERALFGSKALDAGLVGTAAILNATASPEAALKAITITTAGVVLAKELINQYSTIHTFGTHLYKVRQLVLTSMDDYATRNDRPVPANYCKAYQHVVNYASLCSLAAMKSMLDQQVAIRSTTAPPAVVTPGGAESGLRPRTMTVVRPGATTSYTVRPQ